MNVLEKYVFHLYRLWRPDPCLSYLHTCFTPHSLCRTIVYLSIVYTLGQVVLAVSAIHDITDTNRDGTPDNLNLHM